MAAWRCLLWLLAVFAAWPADAQTKVLLVREETPVAQQTAEIINRELLRQGWAVNEVTVAFEKPVPDLRRDGDQMLVALGTRALIAAARQAAGRPVVAALISRPALEELLPVAAERWSAITLDQPVERWLDLIQLAFPQRGQVGVLLGPVGQRSQRILERKFQERRLPLAVETIASAEEVVPALERLLPRMNLLLALPDPLAHNRNTVQPLLLTTYRAGVPVVAYSESYQQAGAVVALYSTLPQIAYQVIESLQQYADGRPPASVQVPRYYTVGVNGAVARSLGLLLPPAGELQDRLRTMDQ